MKPAPFEYVLAASVDEVTQVLACSKGEAIILAGGQTLMPMLSMRLARPDLVIDINEISELSGIEDLGEKVIIRAGTRQVLALNSPIVAARLPLLHKGLNFVGHLQTRNRGTVGGSIAHADPSAEIPLVALTLGAEVELESVRGRRRIPIKDFIVGPLMTAREADELLIAIHFPTSDENVSIGTSFREVSERHGDFAVVAVAAHLTFDGAICTNAAVAFGGVDNTPVRIPQLEKTLVGQTLFPDIPAEALDLITDAISPSTDQHGTASYRRRVARELAARAIEEAAIGGRGRNR